VDDSDAVVQVLAGDRDAFEHLVRRYHRKLYYYVAGKMADGSEAEDIVQKAFVTAYHSLTSFEQERSFYDWLRGIALNHCRNEWRQAARRSRLKGELLDAKRAEWQLEQLDQPGALEDERMSALRQCLDTLGAHDRQVVQQRFVEELPLAEIGQGMGKTTEGARQYLFRLRLRLAECVKRRLQFREAGA
jgi:RNA polymerase sigma-70 factor (ECF subfamily)